MITRKGCCSGGASIVRCRLTSAAMANRAGPHRWRALVGGSGKPDRDDTMVGFLAFYRRRAAGADVTEAVEAMRDASGYEWFAFDFAKRVRRTSDA